MDKIEILQKIYDSEINFAIMSPCWDGGFTVAIQPRSPYGEDWSNCQYKSECHETLDDAIDHLIEKVVELYPNSVFTVNYLNS